MSVEQLKHAADIRILQDQLIHAIDDLLAAADVPRREINLLQQIAGKLRAATDRALIQAVLAGQQNLVAQLQSMAGFEPDAIDAPDRFETV